MDGRVASALRIRARHLRQDLDWLLWAAGTSIDESKGILGAWYLAYVLVVAVAWSLFSWAALEHYAAEFLAILPASRAFASLGFVIGAWCVAAFIRAARALWRSPFRLFPADIAWLLGSRRALAAMAVSDAAVRCAGACVLGALAGLLSASGMPFAVRAWAAALSALAGLCATLLPCVVAEARLAREKPDARPVGAALLAGAATCAMAASAALLRVPAAPEALLCTLTLALVACSIVFERSICLPALACESVADTESPAMRWLRLTDYSLYRELARSTRLARRKRLVRLPLCRSGWKTLVSRAVLVHVRRVESLADILLFAGGYVPLLCALCLGVPGRELLVPGAAAMLLAGCRRARELIRVFDADEGNRLVRPLLPVGTLQLLVADSLPALLIAIAASCIASIAALGRAGLAPQACAICALIDIATVVCGGISRIALPKAGGRMSFELAFLVVVAAACLASFSGEWLAIAAMLAALVLVGAAAVLLGREAVP